jgi:hypothetical protein
MACSLSRYRALWPTGCGAGRALPDAHSLHGDEFPYHVGTGWFGGLLPAIVFAINTATGSIYSGALVSRDRTAIAALVTSSSCRKRRTATSMLENGCQVSGFDLSDSRFPITDPHHRNGCSRNSPAF